MSKHKDKAPINVPPGQACVVMKREHWEHMVEVYSIMASDCEDLGERSDWLSVVDLVKTWVEATYNDPRQTEKVAGADDDGWF